MSAKVLSLSVFVLVYVVYHLTLIQSVPGGDSGELLAESCLLGTPHPPGYPLFTVLSHIVEKVTFPRLYLDKNFWIVVDFNSSIAWQVNHMCAIFGALAAAFVCLSAFEVVNSTKINVKSHASVTVGALLFAFSPFVWEYSTTAEVFAINNCLCSILLYLSCKIYTNIQLWNVAIEGDKHAQLNAIASYTLLGALTSGLALSNQHASLLQISYLIPYILCLLYVSRVPNLWSLTVKSGLCFLTGLLPYAYLPIASMRPTPGSWGDQTSLSGFLRHVLRSEYGTFQLGVIEGEERAVERISIYLWNVSSETGHAIFPVILIGLLLAYYLSDSKADIDALSTVEMSSTKTGTKPVKGGNINTQKRINSHVKNKASAIDVNKNTNRRSAPHLPLALLGLWLWYTLIWHCVLSNLPLSSPMPFAVHSRFWMQPNIVLYVLMSVGCCLLSNIMTLFQTQRSSVLTSSVDTSGPQSYNIKQLLIVDLPVILTVTSVVLFARFALQDRSKSGVVLRQYAALTLSSLPPHALLLAHTDLDWNPVRYLRHCEAQRPDVTHLSFQLMPYPWFRHKQAALYPNVRFTPEAFSFREVSTERSSEGNARMIRTFLSDNGIEETTYNNNSAVFPGGFYLDMQSVNEMEIGSLSEWRGLVLQPWGTLYRVYSRAALTMEDYQHMQHDSAKRLNELVQGFPTVDARFVAQYPAGSWEYAAASVYCDAHYQLGLNLLTYSMELQRNISLEVLPLLLDRLLYSHRVLSRALEMGQTFGTFSSSLFDLHKNTALSSMRLHAVIAVVSQYQKETLQQFHKSNKEHPNMFLDSNAISSLLTTEGIATAQDFAIELMGGFVRAYPKDKDAKTFRSTVDKLIESRGKGK